MVPGIRVMFGVSCLRNHTDRAGCQYDRGIDRAVGKFSAIAGYLGVLTRLK